MEAAYCKNAMRKDFKVHCGRQTQPQSHSSTNAKKKANIVALNNDGRARPSNSKRSSFDRKESKENLVLPPFVGCKKLVALLDQWVKYQLICLPLDHFSSIIDQKTVTYYPYHRRKGYPLEQCMVFGRLFDEKIKACEIFLLQEGGLVNAMDHCSCSIKTWEKAI